MTHALLDFFPHHESFTSKPRDFGQHDKVTSRGEEQNRRSTDASRLTFPLQLVLIIVAGIVSVTGAFWVANSSLRSDMRDIKTSLDNAIQSQNLQLNDMRAQIEDGRRKEAMDAVRIEEMRSGMSEIKGFLTGAGILKGSVK